MRCATSPPQREEVALKKWERRNTVPGHSAFAAQVTSGMSEMSHGMANVSAHSTPVT